MSTITSGTLTSVPPIHTGDVVAADTANTVTSRLTLLNTSSSETAVKEEDFLKDGNGAPRLENPVKTLSPDDLINALEALRTLSLTGQEKNAKNVLEKSGIDSRQANENRANSINEWIKKCDKEAKSNRIGKIFSWVGKIAAFVAAVASVVIAGIATAASVGGAAPMLALACIGLASATLSLVDQIAKEAGCKMDISLSTLLAKPMEFLLKACGVSNEKAEQISRASTMAAVLICPGLLLIEPQMAGSIAKGFCEACGASDKVAMGVSLGIGLGATFTVGLISVVLARNVGAANSAISATAKTLDALKNTSSRLIDGGTQIGQGATKIASAIYQRQASDKLVDKAKLDALLLQLQRSMDDSLDQLTEVIQMLQDGVESVSTLINSFGESNHLINQNMLRTAV